MNRKLLLEAAVEVRKKIVLQWCVCAVVLLEVFREMHWR
jgi:hypothetical protein